jgi:polyferredoxin
MLNYFGVSAGNAAIFGAIFGLIGILIIIFISRRLGIMSHCTLYCPIGLLAVLFGKLSPFRIRITNECTSCMKCHYECRYNALNFEDIKKGKPNLNCTLCGDCISPCEHSSINYRFLKFKPETARVIFIVMIVSLHTAFLAIGRI